MMRRLITFILLLITVSVLTRADEAFDVTLSKFGQDTWTRDISDANISIKLGTCAPTAASVTVTIENTSNSDMLMLFKYPLIEKQLKRHKPKIEFAKHYASSSRSVTAFNYAPSDYTIIKPATKREFIVAVNLDNPTFTIPLYVASYQIKKNGDIKKFTIRDEINLRFDLKIQQWSELDPTYVRLNEEIKQLKESLKPNMFCTNKSHSPKLDEQQQPYVDEINKIKEEITQIMRQWMSTDAPYKAYDKLLAELNKINLNDYNYDCKKHKGGTSQPSCGYCKMREEDIFQNLDRTYQQLHTGKISKESAVKTAQALYNCYTNHQNRSKRTRTDFYSSKITTYYNRIVNF